MGITIARIMKLPIMNKAFLTAGLTGITRIVEGIAMMESPDSIAYLEKDNLILTNAQIFQDHADFTKTAIETLYNMGVAGIALKLNRYLSEVPLPMKTAADRLGFPIITLPKDITSTQLINSITYEILYSNAYDPRMSFAENVLREIFISGSSRRPLKNRALSLGWDLNKTLGVIVLGIPSPISPDRFIPMLNSCGFTFVIPLEGLLTAVADLEDREMGQTILEEQASRALNALRQEGISGMKIGIGRCYNDMEKAHYSYMESRYALAMGMTGIISKPLISFGHMGIYSVLLDPRNKAPITAILGDTIDYLRQYDRARNTEYIKTLEVYIQQKQSIEKTAQRLFIHYNSVRYRLQKIHELMEKSVMDCSLDQLCILLNISRCRDYLRQCAAEPLFPPKPPGAS
uniref:PucR family transcriptional regulator n=1 Tax=Enterocloster aldenensis TaxID=358742 RepID=UPI0014082562